MLAPAGEAAAKIAHEGAVQAARGADVAARYAKLAVSASSPYAAAALTEAQVAAGVMYNEAGKLVNAAGKFVNPAGVVLTKAAARAQGEIVKAAKIMLPMGKNALSAAQVCAAHCGGVAVCVAVCSWKGACLMCSNVCATRAETCRCCIQRRWLLGQPRR